MNKKEFNEILNNLADKVIEQCGRMGIKEDWLSILSNKANLCEAVLYYEVSKDFLLYIKLWETELYTKGVNDFEKDTLHDRLSVSGKAAHIVLYILYEQARIIIVDRKVGYE